MLHRYPVVTPDKEPWEQEFIDLQERIGVAQREVTYVTSSTTSRMIMGAPLSTSYLIYDLPQLSQHYMSLVGGTPAQMICDTDPVSDFRVRDNILR